MRRKFQRINLKPENILLDLNNPRYHKFENEKECIEFMFDDEQTKMEKIINDIIDFGLMESPIIVTDAAKKGNYIVKDGNRRIAAIKAIFNPDILPTKYGKKIKKHKVTDAILDELSNIECHYSNDINAINLNIERIHQNEFEGKGINAWQAIQQYYFMKNNDKADKHYLHKTMFTIEKADFTEEEIYSINNITTIERILGSKVFESLMQENNCSEDVVIKVTRQIVNEVSNKIINVTHVETGALIKEYLQEKIDLLQTKKMVISSDPSSAESASVTFSGTSTITSGSGVTDGYPTPEKEKPRKPTKQSHDRKKMIEHSETIKTNIPKLNDILFEVSKKMEVKNMPVTAGIILRVVLELSVDGYIEKYPGKLTGQTVNNKNVSKNEKLKYKIMYCAQSLISAGKINKNERKMIDNLANNEDHWLVKELHAFVHDSNHSSSWEEANKTWDKYKNFIKLLWIPEK